MPSYHTIRPFHPFLFKAFQSAHPTGINGEGGPGIYHGKPHFRFPISKIRAGYPVSTGIGSAIQTATSKAPARRQAETSEGDVIFGLEQPTETETANLYSGGLTPEYTANSAVSGGERSMKVAVAGAVIVAVGSAALLL